MPTAWRNGERGSTPHPSQDLRLRLQDQLTAEERQPATVPATAVKASSDQMIKNRCFSFNSFGCESGEQDSPPARPRAHGSLSYQRIFFNAPQASHGSFYDLGHGYCTYDFFEQCQHRMACGKCDFYMPKDSTAALLLQGKTHLWRLLQEIPLGEAEQAAVEDGIAAYERLLSKLADVPTPAGPAPHQTGTELVQITSFRQVAMPVAQDGGAKAYR